MPLVAALILQGTTTANCRLQSSCHMTMTDLLLRWYTTQATWLSRDLLDAERFGPTHLGRNWNVPIPDVVYKMLQTGQC